MFTNQYTFNFTEGDNPKSPGTYLVQFAYSETPDDTHIMVLGFCGKWLHHPDHVPVDTKSILVRGFATWPFELSTPPTVAAEPAKPAPLQPASVHAATLLKSNDYSREIFNDFMDVVQPAEEGGMSTYMYAVLMQSIISECTQRLSNAIEWLADEK
jgi:hypothetical protein